MMLYKQQLKCGYVFSMTWIELIWICKKKQGIKSCMIFALIMMIPIISKLLYYVLYAIRGYKFFLFGRGQSSVKSPTDMILKKNRDLSGAMITNHTRHA